MGQHRECWCRRAEWELQSAAAGPPRSGAHTSLAYTSASSGGTRGSGGGACWCGGGWFGAWGGGWHIFTAAAAALSSSRHCWSTTLSTATNVAPATRMVLLYIALPGCARRCLGPPAACPRREQ
eukprot:TRINITY_DN22275_c0_g2_i1.p2 TRINITY_DN22275_c0_g2~~TRINITY_DN22275_c0_g2_i1.p2  ORF type:complete len:124 (-),score=9.69 TRINITY_DN22275_c0_g2_i1:22-393(-)